MVFKSNGKEVRRKKKNFDCDDIFFIRLHQIILMINLCLALFEQPSSFSVTSDVRDKPQRIIFPYMLVMIIEGLSLSWFLFYISTKVRD
jgi:hypothetical protein